MEEYEAGQYMSDPLRNKLLTRLVVVACLGVLAILAYATQNSGCDAIMETFSVGFLAAGASWIAGALVGFIFGIPHVRRNRDDDADKKPSPQDPAKSQKQLDNNDLLRDSTSLEEISDWITKMVVGVGLTQLSQIPHKVKALGAYIASGMNGCGNVDCESNGAVGTLIFVYFVVDGFLFGYLWGRLYMSKEFRAASQ